MKIVSVNVGQPQPLVVNGGVVESGIVKRPVAGPVMVRRTNLEGDGQADLSVHGGLLKAVYAYSSEYYPLWSAELGEVDLPFGRFGENLTTAGMLDEDVLIGDRWQAGSAVLVVTQPRMPCFKFAAHLRRPDAGQLMVEGRRHGYYFSVAEEGNVRAGDEVRLLWRDPSSISVAQTVSLYLGRSTDPELLRRAMSLEALPAGWRNKLAMRAGV